MNPPTREDARAIGVWLLLCCAVLMALVTVGGATRLTGSGLSITEWRPVTGVLPPLTEQAWLGEFDKYRQSPEYQAINRGMSLDAFKTIYWWEWGHRLLARGLGLVFALPLAWFWVRRRVPPGLHGPLLGILALGAVQGWLGWYMVQSGLVDMPRVSPYRLAAHLGLALVIYAAMFWLALRCLWPARSPAVPAAKPAHRGVLLVLALVAVTIVSGAFVAGLKAGYMYNTFPLMGGRWIPEGLFYLEPAWINLFENPVMVQWVHRLLGVTTLALALGLWLWSLGKPLAKPLRWGIAAVALAVALQAALGITTLLMQVPVLLGTLHQGGAVIVLTAVLAAAQLGRPSTSE